MGAGVNGFKVFLLKKNISQLELSNRSGLSITTLHRVLNFGVYTEDTVFYIHRCLTLIYKMDITEQEIIDMINEKY